MFRYMILFILVIYIVIRLCRLEIISYNVVSITYFNYGKTHKKTDLNSILKEIGNYE